MIPATLSIIFFLLHLFFFIPTSSSSSVTISVTPTTLLKSGDHVNIQWSGINNPSKLDWLGIYSPVSSTNDNFIGYIFLNTSSKWESGSGSISIPLVNLRSNYQFRIFRWTESEMINATSFDNDHNPLPGMAANLLHVYGTTR